VNLDRIPRLPTVVVVVGGDAIVGQALELLLWSADRSVRFLNHRCLNEQELPKETGLLLLAPGVEDGCRESLLAAIGSRPPAERIPVLELVLNDQEVRDGVERLVPWPCRVGELARRVEAALLGG
jgi:hypothetical protein